MKNRQRLLSKMVGTGNQEDYFNIDRGQPETIVYSSLIDKNSPAYDFIYNYQRCVIPIIYPDKDNPEHQRINGTCFFLSFGSFTYLVTARHNIIDSGIFAQGSTKANDDYILGFEGRRLNEYFYLTKKLLDERTLKWKVGKHELFDVAVCKVSLTDEVIDVLDINPYPLVIDYNLEFGKDDPVYSFGYIKGWGQLASKLDYTDVNGKRVDASHSAIMTLIPYNLQGSMPLNNMTS